MSFRIFCSYFLNYFVNNLKRNTRIDSDNFGSRTKASTIEHDIKPHSIRIWQFLTYFKIIWFTTKRKLHHLKNTLKTVVVNDINNIIVFHLYGLHIGTKAVTSLSTPGVQMR